MRASLPAMASLGLVAACAPSVRDPVFVPAASGDLVVVVGEPREGSFAVQTAYAESADPSLAILSLADRPIFVWVLRPGDFRNADGQALFTDGLRHVTARFAPQSPKETSCGFCPVPTASPPAIVSPGAACPLPPFIEGRVLLPDGAGRFAQSSAPDHLTKMEELSRALIIDWPGTCTTVESKSPRLDLDRLLAIAPEASPEIMDRFAALADGTILGVGAHAMFESPPTSTAAILRPLDLEGGRPVAISALQGAARGLMMAVRRYDRTFQHPTDAWRLELPADGRPPELSPLSFDLPFLVYSVRSLPFEGFLFLGAEVNSLVSEPFGLAGCGPDLQGCRTLDWPACADGTLPDHVKMRADPGDGSVLYVANAALYLEPPGSPGPSSCLTFPEPLSTPDGSEVTIHELKTAAGVGDRFYVCANSTSDECAPGRAVILTATTAAAGAPRFRVTRLAGSGAYCGGFHRLSEPDRLRFIDTAGMVVDLDAAGASSPRGHVTEVYGPSAAGLWDIVDLGQEIAVARGPGNGVHASRRGDPFRAIYGSSPESLPAPLESYRATVAMTDGTFVALAPRGLSLVDPSPLQPTIERIDLGASLDPGVVLEDLVLDETRGNDGLMVAGRDADGGFLGRIDLGRKPITVEPVELPDVAPIRRLTGLAAGRFAWITTDSRVFVTRGESTIEVPIEWDDPSTEEREPPPQVVGSCGATPAAPDALRAIAGKGDTAWIGGTNGLLLRLAGGRAERFALEGPVNQATVTALLVRRPDRLDFAAMDLSWWPGTHIWRVEPSREGDEALEDETRNVVVRRGLTFTRMEDFRPTVQQYVISRIPVAVLEDGESLAAVFFEGLVHRASPPAMAPLLMAGGGVAAAARNEVGELILVGSEGRIVLGLPDGELSR